jgi:hypothetical protein
MRETAAEKFLITLNLTDSEKEFSLSDDGNGTVTLSTYLDLEGNIAMKAIQLRPYEGLVIKI